MGFFILKPKTEKSSIAIEAVTALICSLFTLYFSELINIVGHSTLSGYHSLFAYMNRRIYSTDTVISLRFPIEMILLLVFYLLMRIFLSPKISLAVAPAPFLLLAIANYCVYTFRGSELLFSDLFGAGTAAHVAAGYSFPIMMPLTFIIIPYALFILAVRNINFTHKNKRDIKSRLIPLSIMVLLSVSFIPLYSHYTNIRPVYAYQDQGSQANGVTVNFLMSATTLKLHKPDSYDESIYSGLVSSQENPIEDAPNIIVIMNESLADMSIYSDVIGEMNADPLPFIHSLGSESIHGFARASVFGGRTANSEYEYLTGITTYGLPEGMLPYPMKINSETYSMASYLSDCGYHTVAVHPYVGDGWDRDIVYPLLGFEETMFIDDFTWQDDDMINGYMTDMCLYENILDRIDSEDDTRPDFYFIVSIQNHGGYDGEMGIPDHFDYVPADSAYSEVINNYVSLSHQSDIAFEYLINELASRDEEYIVVMFGDHQPNLSFNSLYTADGGDGWLIPYIIWDNRGIEAQSVQDITSINYLGIDTLNAAGIPLSPYFEYISGIREDIPCINSAGYVSLVSEDATSSDLDRIRGLQYYTLERN
jgi:phosphoglycerol transferase MdoB-like AlkP superfamily enzyme